jgi:hypothetical protein
MSAADDFSIEHLDADLDPECDFKHRGADCASPVLALIVTDCPFCLVSNHLWACARAVALLDLAGHYDLTCPTCHVRVNQKIRHLNDDDNNGEDSTQNG